MKTSILVVVAVLVIAVVAAEVMSFDDIPQPPSAESSAWVSTLQAELGTVFWLKRADASTAICRFGQQRGGLPLPVGWSNLVECGRARSEETANENCFSFVENEVALFTACKGEGIYTFTGAAGGGFAPYRWESK